MKNITSISIEINLKKKHSTVYAFYYIFKRHRKNNCINLTYRYSSIFFYFWIYLFPVGCRILSVLCNNLCLGLRNRRFCFVCSPARFKSLYISAGEVACIAIYFIALLETYTLLLLNNKGLLRSYSDNK